MAFNCLYNIISNCCAKCVFKLLGRHCQYLTRAAGVHVSPEKNNVVSDQEILGTIRIMFTRNKKTVKHKNDMWLN